MTCESCNQANLPEEDAKDTERLDWMEKYCADWKDCCLTYYPTNSALEWKMVDTCADLRQAIDEAMKQQEA